MAAADIQNLGTLSRGLRQLLERAEVSSQGLVSYSAFAARFGGPVRRAINFIAQHISPNSAESVDYFYDLAQRTATGIEKECSLPQGKRSEERLNRGRQNLAILIDRMLGCLDLVWSCYVAGSPMTPEQLRSHWETDWHHFEAVERSIGPEVDLLAVVLTAVGRPMPAVILRGRTEPPIVFGKEQSPLSAAEYDVVEALCKAGEKGLSKKELDRKSQHTDARKILYRLAKKSRAWAKAICLPGKSGRRYHVRRYAR